MVQICNFRVDVFHGYLIYIFKHIFLVIYFPVSGLLVCAYDLLSTEQTFVLKRPQFLFWRLVEYSDPLV